MGSAQIRGGVANSHHDEHGTDCEGRRYEGEEKRRKAQGWKRKMLMNPLLCGGKGKDAPLEVHITRTQIHREDDSAMTMENTYVGSVPSTLTTPYDFEDLVNEPVGRFTTVLSPTDTSMLLRRGGYRSMQGGMTYGEDLSDLRLEIIKAKEIGRGNSAEVWKVWENNTNQQLAMKSLRIPKEEGHAKERTESLMKEIGFLRELSGHPNIVNFRGYRKVRGEHQLFLDYEAGESLAKRLKLGPLPIHITRQLTYDILMALCHLHDHGVIHNDIKPANILMDGRGRCKLSDFGVATRVNEIRNDMELHGTVQYMAPEKLLRKEYTTKSDIWSVGIVLIEMLQPERLQGEPSDCRYREPVVRWSMKAMEGQKPCYPDSADWKTKDFLDAVHDYNLSIRPEAEELLKHVSYVGNGWTIYDRIVAIQRTASEETTESLFQEYSCLKTNDRLASCDDGRFKSQSFDEDTINPSNLDFTEVLVGIRRGPSVSTSTNVCDKETNMAPTEKMQSSDDELTLRDMNPEYNKTKVKRLHGMPRRLD